MKRLSLKELLRPENILYACLALAPFIAGGISYSHMPEQVPIHWSTDNTPDNFASRAFALFVIPCFLLLLNAAVQFVISFDPKRENLQRSGAMLAIVKWVMVLLPIFTQSLILFQGLSEQELDIGMACMLGVGLLLAAIGNYLPKCQPNYTVGIRLPWTLADEANWRKTHRLAGPVWVIGGLVIAVLAFTPWRALDLLVLIPMVLIPALYSFFLYRRKKNEKGES